MSSNHLLPLLWTMFLSHDESRGAWLVSDIAIFVLKRDVKLQLTNMAHGVGNNDVGAV